MPGPPDPDDPFMYDPPTFEEMERLRRKNEDLVISEEDRKLLLGNTTEEDRVWRSLKEAELRRRIKPLDIEVSRKTLQRNGYWVIRKPWRRRGNR